jgi:hypothetical protein
MEADYKKLCKALKIEPYTTDMVALNMERMSCRIVHEKLCGQYGIDPVNYKLGG